MTKNLPSTIVVVCFKNGGKAQISSKQSKAEIRAMLDLSNAVEPIVTLDSCDETSVVADPRNPNAEVLYVLKNETIQLCKSDISFWSIQEVTPPSSIKLLDIGIVKP